eukprot:5516067-Pyramimonas_sp.AAC.1
MQPKWLWKESSKQRWESEGDWFSHKLGKRGEEMEEDEEKEEEEEEEEDVASVRAAVSPQREFPRMCAETEGSRRPDLRKVTKTPVPNSASG